MVRRALALLVILSCVAGCGPVRQEIFALVRDAPPAASGGIEDAGGQDDAGVDGVDGVDGGAPPDASMPVDGGEPSDAGQDVDASMAPSFTCPKGHYLGNVSCDFGDTAWLVVGEIDFVIGEVNGSTRKAPLEDGVVSAYLPVSSDDLTPAVDLNPVAITGSVTCIPGAPPQLSAESAEISFIGTETLPPPVILSITASADNGALFVGRYSVSGGTLECFGTFSAGPASEKQTATP